ncbi:L,D-transpeptidase [Allochromatium palmeri]|nr:L,D-transpeptidase [Allochromatium palmeri]
MSNSFKAGVGSFIVLGLVGCDGLARFASKPDVKPAEPVMAEVSEPAPPSLDEQAAADKPEKKDKTLATPLYEWKGDGRSITRIVVNTDDQKARFYSGDEEVGWSTVATGLPKYPTPTGRFQVTEKVENKRSNLYGKVYGKGGRVLRSSVKVGRDPIPDGGRFEGARMPFFMRLTDDGVGLHAGPIPNPGRPASHGCIRMPSKLAPVLFRHVSNGTPVTIEGKGPSYGDYVAKQRAKAARRAEERRIAEQRAAEAKKTQQVAQTTPSADRVSNKPEAEASIESRAVAKDDAVPAAQTLDATNARETRMREPATQPEATADTADTPATSPETEIASAVEAAKPAPTEPPQASIIEAAPQNAPAPADGLPSSIREGTIELGPQPAASASPVPSPASAPTPPPGALSSAEAAPAAALPKLATEIQEAPAPKPVEPAPSAAPTTPEPPVAAPAAPVASAPE